MSQLTPEDFRVWGKQKATAKLGASSTGPIGGYDPNKKAEPQEKQKSRINDDSDEVTIVAQPAKNSPQVNLSNPRFIVPAEGVTFNGFCDLAVDVEYLQETILSKVTFELRAIHNNKDELIDNNLAANENNGIAQVKARLYYHNDNRDDTPSEYYFIARHSKGKKEAASPKVSVPVISPGDDRWIIFEETAEKVDTDFPYEMSKAQSPKNRWIYVFGSQDGSIFTRAWEIKTDSSGKKYATFEVNENDYDSRPEQEQWEEVAFLPAQSPDKTAMHFASCISDVRLSKERIFDKKHGLLSDPMKRCALIDDPKQAVKKQLGGGEEKIVLINTLLHAEMLRKKFDDAYPKWEKSRAASWLENDDSKKKEKLLHEFGALVVRIIEAYPEYRKHLAPGQYPKLYEQVKAYDEKKVRLTTDITNLVESLSLYLRSDQFAETCKDYTFLIRSASDQSKELYAFEDRVGKLVEDITRFPQGAETIKQLLPQVKTQDAHSWLQNLLLLKNDTWSVSSGQSIGDSKPGMSGAKKFQNIRKLGDGAVKLLIEGAKSGAATYKPQELADILQKVFATTGQSVGLGVLAVRMTQDGIRPFQKVLGSFDKSSFWRFEFKGQSPYENMFADGLKSAALKKLLLGLEGVALIYSVKDHMEKSNAGKAGTLDNINIIAKLLTYFVKSEMIKVPYKGEVVKIGGGPIAVANGICSAIDFFQTGYTGLKDVNEKDTDAAIFNFLSATGNLAAATGYGTLAATFFAGAAATSSTGIGIAPGLLLVFTGSVIAIGGKILAADADNTPLENMLLKTPWGTHPETPESTASSMGLQKQYVGAMRLINSYRVSINHDTMVATLHLLRLEPTTAITIHEVTFGIPTRSDGSSSTSQVVGTGIKLNDSNCEVIKDAATGTLDLRISLNKVCSGVAPFLQQWKGYYNSFGKEPRPDYIKLLLTVDLDGDGIMVLPDDRKKLCAEKHYGQKIKTIIV